MKKRGFTLIELLAVILILGIIALIAIPTVNKVVKQAKERSFKSSVENIIKSIEQECQTELLKGETLTTSYIFSNGVVLPNLDIKGKLPSSGTISVDNNCKTTVNVTNGTYIVSKGKEEYLIIGKPYINMKEKVDELIDNSSTYEYMNGTYLKGIQNSNYLWYSGNLYRIMGYDENNNVRLISEGNVTGISYNPIGQSSYTASFLEDWLNTYFYNHINNSILQDTSYCTDLTKDVSSARTTCTNSVTNTKITTISLDEYRLAAKPTEYACNDIGYRLYQWDFMYITTQADFHDYLTSEETTCMTYVKDIVNSYSSSGIIATYDDANEKVSINTSYLDDSSFDVFWTLTSYDSNYVWLVSSNDSAKIEGTSRVYGVRPIITISSDITITGGNGTLASPIMIEEQNAKSGKLIDNAKSGEYVALENKLYRVVDKVNETGTKLILDGYLQSIDTYTDMTTKMSNNIYLKELGLTVGDSRLVNYTWDRGNIFEGGNNYTLSLEPSSNTFQSKVGGIRIGEMYSSQSNSITIEDKESYWMLNTRSLYSAWNVYISGRFDNHGFDDGDGVRPAIMISSNTSIIGGNGTLGNPYKI